jgi:hypothetical protein
VKGAAFAVQAGEFTLMGVIEDSRMDVMTRTEIAHPIFRFLFWTIGATPSLPLAFHSFKELVIPHLRPR